MNWFFRRMVAALSVISLLAGVPAAASAKPGHRPAHRPAAAQTLPAGATKIRPALWKVSDKDTTIWLFGTIHALP